jgi:hypothetical protein
LGLVGCKKSRGKLDLQLVLSVYGKGQVPSELETLRGTEVDTTLGLDFCINGVCEENEFRSEAREWGNVLLKDITIDRNQEKIRSMRVILPNESMKYEYQGDVDGILKKFAKRRQTRIPERAHPLPTFRGFFAISFDNGKSRA